MSNEWSHHFRATLRLGLPLVAAQVATILYGVTDTIMLGWYSVDALAAGVLAGTFFFAFMIAGTGFAHAVTPLVAAALGAEDEVRARRGLRMGLWVVAVFGVISMPAFWASKALLLAIGQDPLIAGMAQDYLRIAMVNLFPILLFAVLRSYFSALERTGIVFAATFGGLLLNGALNYLFIFGNFGMPELGVRGAAVATVGSGSLVLVVVLIYIRLVRELREAQMFARIWRPDGEVFWEIVRLGAPISAMLLAETSVFSLSTVMAGWIGTVALAAHGIALQVTSVVFMVPLGLTMAGTARIGRSVGSGDNLGVWRATGAVLALSMGFAMISAMLLWGLPEFWASLFLDGSDPRAAAILSLGAQLLLIAAVFQAVDVAQVVLAGTLRGLRDTSVPMVIALIAYLPVGLGCIYVLAFELGWGAHGLWWGMALGLAVAAVALGMRNWFLLRARYPLVPAKQ